MTKQILATLAYSDIFDYPLTIQEIWQWLINRKSEIKNQKSKFNQELKNLIKKKLCDKRGEFYFLPKRQRIINTRKQREKWSKEKLKIAEKVAGILRFIPWIKLIGLTGALARKNTPKDDDIDLFFITTPNRLWLTRGLVVLILRILRLYRRPNKVVNMICPNMLVSEDALKMIPEDLFTAHEVCLMKPLFEKDKTHQKFLEANSWVEKFLPNIYRRLTRFRNADKRRISVNQLINQRQSVFERVARDLQLWYMRKRRTDEVVTDNLIKFHPEDVRLLILKKYQEKLKNLLA